MFWRKCMALFFKNPENSGLFSMQVRGLFSWIPKNFTFVFVELHLSFFSRIQTFLFFVFYGSKYMAFFQDSNAQRPDPDRRSSFFRFCIRTACRATGTPTTPWSWHWARALGGSRPWRSSMRWGLPPETSLTSRATGRCCTFASRLVSGNRYMWTSACSVLTPPWPLRWGVMFYLWFDNSFFCFPFDLMSEKAVNHGYPKPSFIFAFPPPLKEKEKEKEKQWLQVLLL